MLSTHAFLLRLLQLLSWKCQPHSTQVPVGSAIGHCHPSPSSFSCRVAASKALLSANPPPAVLARSLIDLLPPIEVAAASWCNADPDRPEEWEVGVPVSQIFGFGTQHICASAWQLPLWRMACEAGCRHGRHAFQPPLAWHASRAPAN